MTIAEHQPERHSPPTGWTEERIAVLKARWAEGASCAQIAAELGGVSRNAVIGKIHRLGLSGQSRTETERAPRAARPRTAGQPGRAPERKPACPPRPLSPGERYRPMSERDVAAPDMRPCSLMDLTERTCRFPIGIPGTPGFHFCGANAVIGLDRDRRRRCLPYCAFHARIAYLPVVEPAAARSAA
jgi:GcrA cell cycle regulator